MALEIKVKAQPKSAKPRVEQLPDGSYKVWVHAPPADGAANKAIGEQLAVHFGVSQSCVILRKGQTSRHKVYHIEGL
jgi:uncharacterized protein